MLGHHRRAKTDVSEGGARPRLIRQRDAPGYLGMDRNKFNKDVRPFLTEIPLGRQALAFDRLELDAWVEEYIECNGRRPKAPIPEDDIRLSKTVCRGSAKKAGSGTLKSAAYLQQEDGSEKARAHLLAIRQSKS